MSGAIDLLLSRLPDHKPTGRDRWRSGCPVCGGSSKSALSIGIGDTGAVLVTCFKGGCGPDEIAGAVGLVIEDLFPPREAAGRPLARRRMISDRQALDLMHEESNLVFVAAANIGNGIELTDVDRARLLQAAARIAYLREEVMS